MRDYLLMITFTRCQTPAAQTSRTIANMTTRVARVRNDNLPVRSCSMELARSRRAKIFWTT